MQRINAKKSEADTYVNRRTLRLLCATPSKQLHQGYVRKSGMAADRLIGKEQGPGHRVVIRTIDYMLRMSEVETTESRSGKSKFEHSD